MKQKNQAKNEQELDDFRMEKENNQSAENIAAYNLHVTLFSIILI